MKQQKINHIAVWILVVLFQLLPILWYAPFMLGNKWMHLQGYTIDNFKGGEDVGGLIFSLTGAIIFNYFLAWLLIKLKIETAPGGIKISAMLFLACFLFISLTQNSFSLKPVQLGLINAGIELVLFLIAGFMLSTWKIYKPKNRLI